MPIRLQWEHFFNLHLACTNCFICLQKKKKKTTATKENKQTNKTNNKAIIDQPRAHKPLWLQHCFQMAFY